MFSQKIFVRYEVSLYAHLTSHCNFKLRSHLGFHKELLLAASGARWLLNFTCETLVFWNLVNALDSQESTLDVLGLKILQKNNMFSITSLFIDPFVFIL